ncbi:ribonuclease 2 [Nicotiana attenuata]|uniref:Ribonuclease 2 n=1 Tax=Nicotiana attenuata TaxID=49451 RepID=A0A314LCR8_NICAT|nr:ribonuclease 2 [Nicotiana attenuata]
MTFLPVNAIANLRMLFLLIGACCILVGVNGGWDEEVGLLRRGRSGAGGGYQREFDYFKLSLQWPGTYCRRTRRCCSSNACCSRSNSPPVFTIHGLWTEYNDGTWPACCSGKAFDEREISTLLVPLRKYWPSLSCGSPRSCHHKKGPFWAHEVVSLLSLLIDCLNSIQFKELTHPPCISSMLTLEILKHSGKLIEKQEKHGTCAYPVVHDEYEFFLTTLNVYFKYNVTEVLFEAGYVPSDSEKYPLGGIISSIENAFHATPELTCSGDALEELRICFYKNFEPRDCAHDTSALSRGSCPQYVSLPAHGSREVRSSNTTAAS